MDQPEPPGISPPEGPPLRRLRRLLPTPTAVRRLSPRRLALACLGSVCALALFAAGVAQVGRMARRYVDANPVYRLTYRDITLDPPTPAWFRGGSAAFLNHVLGRPEAGDFQSFSALDFDRDRLLLLFRRDAWVEKALRVEVSHPNRVTVRLIYREPVAVERLRDETERTVVDRDGVILPRTDVDPALLESLVRLCKFDPPHDPEAGQTWNRVEPEQGLAVRNDRVAAAARLAAFLFRQVANDTPGGAVSFPRLFVHDNHGVETYVQVGANLLFLWDEGPRDDRAAPLTAEARWARLRDFARAHPPRSTEPTVYLRFTRTGVEPIPLQREPEQARRSGLRPPVRTK